MLKRIKEHPKAFERQCAKSHRSKIKYSAQDKALEQILSAAKQRCENPNHGSFRFYGQKGVKFCFSSIEQSIRTVAADIGYRPSKKHTIDRIDTFKNYERGNLRWATYAEQACNRRNSLGLMTPGRMKRLLKLMPHWSYPGLRKYVNLGWTDAQILRLQKWR